MRSSAPQTLKEPNPSCLHSYPDWFHHHGTKMRLVSCENTEGRLKIEGSAAKLTITVKPFRNIKERTWRVEWEVRQSLTEKSSGIVIFNNEQLASAFNIKTSYSTESYSQWILGRFGGDRASQGKYIGYGNYLNIPCPGTGHDGDPNVSIELDEEIQKAVKGIMDWCTVTMPEFPEE